MKLVVIFIKNPNGEAHCFCFDCLCMKIKNILYHLSEDNIYRKPHFFLLIFLYFPSSLLLCFCHINISIVSLLCPPPSPTGLFRDDKKNLKTTLSFFKYIFQTFCFLPGIFLFLLFWSTNPVNMFFFIPCFRSRLLD